MDKSLEKIIIKHSCKFSDWTTILNNYIDDYCMENDDKLRNRETETLVLDTLSDIFNIGIEYRGFKEKFDDTLVSWNIPFGYELIIKAEKTKILNYFFCLNLLIFSNLCNFEFTQT